MSKRDDHLRNTRLYSDKMGFRQYTLASLREKVEDQFRAESAGRVDILQELDTRPKRMQELMTVADYVLSQEHVQLAPEDKRFLVEEAVANLFYFGVLDRYLRDPEVTELTLEGPYEAFYRKGFGELQAVAPPYEDVYHLEQALSTLIAPAGAALMESEPFVEVGLAVHQRQVRASLICPPINPLYSAQLRLHPPSPLLLDALTPHFVPAEAGALLQEALASGRGLLVTGEVGMGKTTLLQALLHGLAVDGVTVVERAREMSLPDGFRRWAAIPAGPQQPAQDFASQIRAALVETPRLLVLDEIRGDEAAAFWGALSKPDLPQMMIAFRGSSNPARLYSALRIISAQADPSLSDSSVNEALLAKLPYVAAVGRPRPQQAPRLTLLGKWVMAGASLTLEPLLKLT